MNWQEFVAAEHLGNTGYAWVTAIGVFLVTLLILELFRRYFVRVLERVAQKTKTHWDDVIIEALKKVRLRAYFWIALFAGSRFLTFPSFAQSILDGAILVFIVYYVVKFIHIVIGMAAESEATRRKKAEQQDSSVVVVLGKVAQAILWIVAFLLILANFGIEITPLIASLGVGGIAIAFALQNILEDLFSSFSIYFDKPFREGDFIIIQGDMGTVQHIGLKTTRIQTLQGQELVVSNRELTSTRVNNYRRMSERRVNFQIGVEYSTSAEKLEKVNKIVTEAITSTKRCRLDRTHFHSFGDFSLGFDIVYYVDTRDYAVYMDCQQEINFKIKRAFDKAKISMAFPTQTIHVKK